MYELNFIWVGPNKMPDDQLFNLGIIKDLSRDAVVRIWITSDMHPELKSHLESKGYILEDISQLLDRDAYPITADFVDALRDATLPSGLGDILKFLILTRNKNQNLPTKRFYLEADNNYRAANLKGIVNNRPFMFDAIENPYTKEMMARPDGFYIDTEADVCKPIMDNGAEHVEVLLSDATVNANLKQIILLNKQQGFTHESAVLRSFGMLPTVLCKSLLLRANLWRSEMGNKSFAARDSRHSNRSWLDPRAEEYLKDTAVEENKDKVELIKNSIFAANDISKRCVEIMDDLQYWEERTKDRNKTTRSAGNRPN